MNTPLCTQCNKEIKEKKPRKQTNKKTYECTRSECDNTFETKKEMQEHLKACYADFECPLCGEDIHVLNTIHMLKTHLNYCIPSYKGNTEKGIALFLSSLNDFIISDA